ncbi:hypothetical protein NPIL_702101 [Nephila pilipes]|uniref:Uncharacterized protein n=1 Tax=Nephila pilipes TaxID=299642 RepID=A0A8X6Q4X1_NEPPI|nr:hypothetical protein NPIL_702101 [Nephila pilipes]
MISFVYYGRGVCNLAVTTPSRSERRRETTFDFPPLFFFLLLSDKRDFALKSLFTGAPELRMDFNKAALFFLFSQPILIADVPRWEERDAVSRLGNIENGMLLKRWT